MLGANTFLTTFVKTGSEKCQITSLVAKRVVEYVKEMLYASKQSK